MATAGRTGLKHIVKLSQFAADEASPVRFLRYHAAVERAIIESGMAYTFIRPNLFMQGLLGFSQSVKAEGPVFRGGGRRQDQRGGCPRQRGRRRGSADPAWP